MGNRRLVRKLYVLKTASIIISMEKTNEGTMPLLSFFPIALGLSADAFAVSVCKGLSAGSVKPTHALTAALWFGGFQGLMPLLGGLCASACLGLVSAFDHWIAFSLLACIGAGMIRDAFRPEAIADADFRPAAMLPLALATSIDAFAAGAAIVMSGGAHSILSAVLLIASTTAFLSACGVWVGSRFGARSRFAASLIGGTVLIFMGLRILFRDLGVLP